MEDSEKRKGVKNFVFLPGVQIPYITGILVLVLCVAVVSSGIVYGSYRIKQSQGYFYYLNTNEDSPIEQRSMIRTVAPSLAVALVLGSLLTVLIALFSSRRIALPIFKVQRWAEELARGNLRARLQFREKQAMRSVSDPCNKAVENLCDTFQNLEAALRTLEEKQKRGEPAGQDIDNIHKIIAGVKYK